MPEFLIIAILVVIGIAVNYVVLRKAWREEGLTKQDVLRGIKHGIVHYLVLVGAFVANFILLIVLVVGIVAVTAWCYLV